MTAYQGCVVGATARSATVTLPGAALEADRCRGPAIAAAVYVGIRETADRHVARGLHAQRDADGCVERADVCAPIGEVAHHAEASAAEGSRRAMNSNSPLTSGTSCGARAAHAKSWT